MQLILASNSPRRRQLLALSGWRFSVSPAEVDERPLAGETAGRYVLRLAESKALDVAKRSSPGSVVVAADTCVVDGGDILGKPADASEAQAMLRRLRGRTHEVYTAIAVLRVNDQTLLTDLCVSDVPMRNYADEEMQAYIASGDPLDKAGAYAIQHADFSPVENIRDCYANVMGLPLCHLICNLEKLGIEPVSDIAQSCQSELIYECRIFPQVLRGEK